MCLQNSGLIASINFLKAMCSALSFSEGRCFLDNFSLGYTVIFQFSGGSSCISIREIRLFPIESSQEKINNES